jgi:hypothetical protein
VISGFATAMLQNSSLAAAHSLPKQPSDVSGRSVGRELTSAGTTISGGTASTTVSSIQPAASVRSLGMSERLTCVVFTAPSASATRTTIVLHSSSTPNASATQRASRRAATQIRDTRASPPCASSDSASSAVQPHECRPCSDAKRIDTDILRRGAEPSSSRSAAAAPSSTLSATQ